MTTTATHPHSWYISRSAVERDGERFFPAVCTNCGAHREFPANPQTTNGAGKLHAPVSECRGHIDPEYIPPVATIMATSPTNMSENMPENAEIVSEQEENVANRNPASIRAKGQEYRKNWAAIIADAKAIGADLTREKWGIPASTWAGWLWRRPDLAAACGVSNSVPNNGHSDEPVKAEPKLAKVVKRVDKRRSHGSHKPSVARDRMAALIRSMGTDRDHPEYRRGLDVAARLVEVA